MIPGVVSSQQLLLSQDDDEDPGVPFSAVAFLGGFNGADGATAFTDESSYAHVATFNGSAQLDTAQSVFGGCSVVMTTTSDSVHFPYNAVFDIGTQPFCLEGRVRFTNVTGTRQLFGLHDTGGSLPRRAWRVVLNNSLGGLYFGSSTDGTTETINIPFGPGGPDFGDFVTNTWYAWCFERDENDNLRSYLNGAFIEKATGFSADLFNLTTKDLIMGVNGDSAASFLGWQDEVRLTVGYSRYASDGGYVLDTSAFPRS